MISKTTKYILPAHWASYLINDDHSGLTSDEKKQADSFLMENAYPNFVGCSAEEYFSSYNDARALPGNVLEFVALDYTTEPHVKNPRRV